MIMIREQMSLELNNLIVLDTNILRIRFPQLYLPDDFRRRQDAKRRQARARCSVQAVERRAV